jgi:hypothetical protein
MTVAQLLGLLNILGLEMTVSAGTDKPRGKVEW